MPKVNIKASNSNMSDKLYKLSDFIPEFSQFRTNEDKFELDALLLMILCLFQLEKVKSILNQ